ncbi:MAG TPA: hypothetical protein VJP85_09180 [Candidatus Baltobacteraceae bacterium]|nr:hypothetical protein [Candidatus Baltobacteraceae bacterium]
MDDLAEVQHLLRHLNDLTGLRKNALVSPLFARGDVGDHELHAQIRRIVLQAVEALARDHGNDGPDSASRWQSIIRRCDLQGELHANVAADLGLGSRQFYRVRRRMHELLRETIFHEFENLNRSTQYVPSTAELGIDLARSMHQHGRGTDAAARLLDIASSAPESAQRLVAIAELSRIYFDLGRAREIGPLIESAHTLCYGPTATGDPLMEAYVHLAESIYAASCNDLPGQIESLRRAQVRAMAAPTTFRAIDVYLEGTIDLAEAHIALGDADAADHYGEAARARLSHRPGFGLRRAQLAQVAGAAATLRGAYREAMIHLNECLAIARDANLPTLRLRAARSIASVQITAEDYSAAREHGRNALLLADAIGNPFQIATTMGILAWIELESKHPVQAIALLKRTRRSYPHNRFTQSLDDTVMAAALSRTGRIPEAVSLVEKTSDTLRRDGLLRYLGRTEVHRAEIYVRAGRVDDARDAIGNAVELLESHGTKAALASAYRVSGELTGNAKHVALAAELTSKISAAFA